MGGFNYSKRGVRLDNSQISVSETFTGDLTRDAYGRTRVSQVHTLFDSKMLCPCSGALFWDLSASSGVTTTHTTQSAVYKMTVPASASNVGIRQTYRRFNYQPGKSMLIVFTGCLVSTGKAEGIITRYGYFDEKDGLFFMQSGSGLYFVRRTQTSGTPVDNVIPQASWSHDSFDGTGPSGVSFNEMFQNIFFIDFEWLGTGVVRYGFFHEGIPMLAGKIFNSNVRPEPFMSNPNLPMRHEITNDGTGPESSLIATCSSIEVEGGDQFVGFKITADRGATGYTTGNNEDIHPVLSVRLKEAYKLRTIVMERIEVIIDSTAAFRWGLYLNPTIAGTDNASWIDINGSSAEYDISRDNTNTLSGGLLLASGYASRKANATKSDFNLAVPLGIAIDGTSDEYVLAVQIVNGGNETVYASMNWAEQF